LRMGRDKAGLVWGDGRSFLDRAVAVLKDCGCERVVVSGDRPGYEHVVDRWPGLGPLGGIASVLEEFPELRGRVLIVPVDMPQLGVETLRPLLDGLDDHDGSRYSASPLPMVLNVGGRVREVVRARLDAGKRSLKGLAAELDFIEIENATGEQLVNINTTEELTAMKSENPSTRLIHHPSVARRRQVPWLGRFATERTGSVLACTVRMRDRAKRRRRGAWRRRSRRGGE